MAKIDDWYALPFDVRNNQTFDQWSGNTGEDTPAAMPNVNTSPSFLAGDQVTRESLPAGSSLPQAGGGDRSTGGVAQSQGGYAPVSGADLQVRQAPIASTQFYNANTGASAHYDPSSGMYIDSNGQSIRPDAIRTRDGGYSGQAGTAGGSGDGGTGAAADPAAAWRDSIRQIIMSRLQQDQGAVDPNSPEIASAVNAAKDQYTRQNTTERDQLAERLYAEGMRGGGGGGLNTDAIRQGIQQSNERTGTALSGLRANLIMNQYNQKHAELSHLLDLATASGDSESARAIQLQIANLQAAVAREGIQTSAGTARYGIDTNADVARSGQGINLAEFKAQLDQNAVLAGSRG